MVRVVFYLFFKTMAVFEISVYLIYTYIHTHNKNTKIYIILFAKNNRDKKAKSFWQISKSQTNSC